MSETLTCAKQSLFAIELRQLFETLHLPLEMANKIEANPELVSQLPAPLSELIFAIGRETQSVAINQTKALDLSKSNKPTLSEAKAQARRYVVKDDPQAQAQQPEKGYRPFRCGFDQDSCGKRFTSELGAWQHIVATHLQLRPYTCQWCGKTFAYCSALRLHSLNFHAVANKTNTKRTRAN